MRVTVLLGGASEEREVSLASGAQVARALREAGHEVTALDPARSVLTREEEERLISEDVPAAAGNEEGSPGGAAGNADGVASLSPPRSAGAPGIGLGGEGSGPERVAKLVESEAIRGADIVFIALHGGAGEDGRMQALLDMAGIRYAGSGPLGCALAMDKEVSKRLFRHAAIPTPDWSLAAPGDGPLERLEPPVIVKPNAGGSTLGLSLVREASEMEGAIRAARGFDERVLVERFVQGRELTVGIVQDRPLPVGEIIPEHELFDYECKYQPSMAREIFPADLPDRVAARLQELAIRAHRALKLSGLSRVDFLLDERERAWCLEANALPGMTANSLLPKAAAAAGIPFPELCDRIVRGGAHGTV